MEGFDQKTAQQMLDAMKEDGLSVNMKVMKSIVAGALEAELEYLRKVGILTAKGEFKAGEYDDDDAFEALLDALGENAQDDDEMNQLAQLLDSYMAAQQDFMEESGLME